LTIPLATDPYAGIDTFVSPPNGQAMIVAVLRAPQTGPDTGSAGRPTVSKEKSAMLASLAKWMNELRIPDVPANCAKPNGPSMQILHDPMSLMANKVLANKVLAQAVE